MHQPNQTTKDTAAGSSRQHRRSWYRTLRGRIILASTAFATLLAILTACVSYRFFMKSLRETIRSSAENNLQIVGSEINISLERVMTFADWVQMDTSVSGYLSRMEQETPGRLSKSGRILSLTVWQLLNDEYNSLAGAGSITRVVVMTADGASFLQCLQSNDRSSVVDTQAILDAPWFSALSEADGYLWELADSAPGERAGTLFIPVVRPIERSTSADIVGYLFLEISPRILTDALDGLAAEEDTAVYLTAAGDTYQYLDGTFRKTEDLPGGVISYALPREGLSLSLLPSSAVFRAQRRYYLLIALLIFAAIFLAGLCFSSLLRRMISVPVSALVAKTELVSRGDFSRDPAIEWDNELGDIGRSINSLSSSVSALMERKVQDEKKRMELEYQILQSQINPHFLYNTLNTVKWMAEIQGAGGISEIATALSRLLKNVSKGTANLIPLRDELHLVEDYFTIMKYRYGGTISLEIHVDEERLYDVPVNRFSLQPIVENAIFHGIEPKGSAGEICIHAYMDKADPAQFLIDVSDNGIGMDEETIRRMQGGTAGESTDFFRHVGISNVNQRIHYSFGPGYGIRIESRKGAYTKVTMTLPAGQALSDKKEESSNGSIPSSDRG